MELYSSAFANGSPLPRTYTCDGQDASPALHWSGAPPGAKSFALICDDPDAPRGTWVHWVLFNLPAGTADLAEGLPAAKVLPSGARQGTNDFRRIGYGGPCPPPGKPHRYFFRLFALDAVLELKEGATKQQLVEAIKGHILEETQMMGTYGR